MLSVIMLNVVAPYVCWVYFDFLTIMGRFIAVYNKHKNRKLHKNISLYLVNFDILCQTLLYFARLFVYCQTFCIL
jgi:hypothetical protein